MDRHGVEDVVDAVAEQYDIEVYDVHESGDTLVIRQDELETTRLTMTSALIFDRYDTEFEHIEVRVPDSGEKTRVSRSEFQQSMHDFSRVIDDDSPAGPYS